MRTILVALAVLLLCQPVAAQPPSRIAEIQGHMQRLEKLGFAGSLLIAQGDSALLESGYGLSNRQAGTRWTPTTISTIGSITKQFTGAAILALAEAGRLDVNDAITKYFPNVPSDKQMITLHQLLTHSSGIVDLDGVDDFAPLGRDEFIRRAMQQELAFAPGKGYQYSNANYSLLGAIVEQVSGKSYETFLRERFFVPAGMKDTGYILAGFDKQRIAQGYRHGENWGTILDRPMAADGPYWVLRANGGIHSTVEDMNRWAQYLLAGKALSAESMKKYWNPYVDEGSGQTFYGYGWVVMDRGGMRVIMHNGGNGILFADMMIIPASHTVMVLQSNVLADFGSVNRLLGELAQHLLTGAPLPTVPDVVLRTKTDLAPYAGTYAMTDGATLNVAAGEGTVDISAADRTAFTLLFSTRKVDGARAERLNQRIDPIVTAFLKGDVGPLFNAYDQGVPREQLQTAQQETMAAWVKDHGKVTGHQVLGTAFRENDMTVVRIRFEKGYIDRAYAWDAEKEGKLLGISRAGVDAVLHAYPQPDSTFASFDPASGDSRSLRIQPAKNGAMALAFSDNEAVFTRKKLKH